MRLSEKQRKEIILKATVELGPLYKYTIKNGGLGLTLIVDAHTKEKASSARRMIPGEYEGLRTLVIYNLSSEEKKDE